MLKDAFILVPPLNEQESIVAYLDSICMKIDILIEKTNRKIKDLQELRTRLIGDAVTGKIDVRGIEIPNYEYVADEADTESDEDVDVEEIDERED